MAGAASSPMGGVGLWTHSRSLPSSSPDYFGKEGLREGAGGKAEGWKPEGGPSSRLSSTVTQQMPPRRAHAGGLTTFLQNTPLRQRWCVAARGVLCQGAPRAAGARRGAGDQATGSSVRCKAEGPLWERVRCAAWIPAWRLQVRAQPSQKHPLWNRPYRPGMFMSELLSLE